MEFNFFLELTPVELFDALQENDKYEEAKILGQVRTICDAIRVQTYHLMNVQLPKGKKIRDPKKLMRFTWDSKPTQTKEEMKAAMKMIAKLWGSKKSKENDKSRSRSVRRKPNRLSRS